MGVGLVATLCAAIALTTTPAHADPVTCGAGEIYDPGTGTCVVVATDPGGDSEKQNPPPTEPVADHGGAAQGQPVCHDRNVSTQKLESVPCRTSHGYWSNDRQCYIRPMKPPPAKSSPLWEGHTDGAVYECVRVAGQVTVSVRFWSKTAPTAPAAPPDPAVVARTVVRLMQLRAIRIGMAPEDADGRVGIVGLPAWMWVADRDAHTFGPMVRSASVGGTSVTATAKVDRIVWSMGDGEAVTCRSAGVPFAGGDGGRESPDCGYTYGRQGRYAVRATSHWTVTWTSNSGAGGTIPLAFTATRILDVGEIQVVRN
ncbi:hypothetical protein [uncultured Friedmanniella sp.]|uniref:hypothetical protein n=1 Tax=uncultured Friedmanniella sp. TaxID=335381 RepID=UPI0035CB3459